MAVLLAGATLVCALPLGARFLSGPAPATMLAAFATLAVLPLLVLAGVSSVTRHVLPASMAAALALVSLVLMAPQMRSDPLPQGARLTVMTVNLNLGTADAAAVVAAVRRSRVDLLAVQELTVEAQGRLEAAGLGSTLPFTATDPGGSASGTGLWSNRPLERLPPWEMTFRSSAAAVGVEGRRLVVRSVHPFPPRWSDDSRWRADLAALRTSVAGDPARETTLLLGDLNATVHHRLFRRVLADGGWRDAGELAGAGVVRTWSPRARIPPLIDLDHVLVPTDFGVHRHEVVDVPGSDHEGVVAELVVPSR